MVFEASVFGRTAIKSSLPEIDRVGFHYKERIFIPQAANTPSKERDFAKSAGYG